MRPSFQIKKKIRLTLKSHPGYGVCLSGEDKQCKNGLEEMLKIGTAETAIQVFIDSEDRIHLVDRPFQVLDGFKYKKRDL